MNCSGGSRSRFHATFVCHITDSIELASGADAYGVEGGGQKLFLAVDPFLPRSMGDRGLIRSERESERERERGREREERKSKIFMNLNQHPPSSLVPRPSSPRDGCALIICASLSLSENKRPTSKSDTDGELRKVSALDPRSVLSLSVCCSGKPRIIAGKGPSFDWRVCLVTLRINSGGRSPEHMQLTKTNCVPRARHRPT